MKKLLKRSFVILMIALLLFTGGEVKKLHDENVAQQTVIHTQEQQLTRMQKIIDYQDLKLKINNNRIHYQQMELKDVHKKVQTEPKVVSVDDLHRELSDANNGLVIHTQESVWGAVISGITVAKEFVLGKLHMN
jgi:predicted nucleic acid-binding protein